MKKHGYCTIYIQQIIVAHIYLFLIPKIELALCWFYFLPHSCNKASVYSVVEVQKMKKMIAICLLTTMSFSTLVGCDVKGSNTVQESKIKKATYKEFTYDVNPETFTLIVEHDGVKALASQPLPKMKVLNVKKKRIVHLGNIQIKK